MSEFKKNSLIMLFLTTAASGINYLCQIILGRVVSIESFGILNSLFSVILVLSVPGVSLNMATANKIATLEQNETHAMCMQITLMKRICNVFSVSLLVIYVLFSNTISQLLSAQMVVVILTGVTIASSFLPFVYSGILSGARAFFLAGMFSLLAPVFKAIGVMMVAFLPFQTNQQQIVVIGMMLCGNIFSVALYRLLFQGFSPARDITSMSIKSLLNSIEPTTINIIGVNFIFLLLTNIDILSITICLGGNQAGLYSSVMLFGRIVFYFTTAIVSVLLPYVSLEKSRGGNASKIFSFSLIATLCVSFICIVPASVFPEALTSLVYGEQYLMAAPYMPLSCGVAILVSVLNLELNYYIGIEKSRKVIIDFTIALLVLLLIIFVSHSTITIILLAILAVLSILVLYEFVGIIFDKTKTNC